MNRELLIFIPTYNESGNVGRIHKEIRAILGDCDLLFVDDNSPDGTGKLLDEIATKDKNTRIIHRPGKSGIGSAHMEAIGWAYQHGYKKLFSMDCDFTHSPEYMPEFIKRSVHAHVVIGSRYMQKDSLSTWNPYRKFLTRLGHYLTRRLLGMPYDASGAFRIYDLEKIPFSVFQKTKSHSYSFFFESLFLLHLNGFTISEIPIHLPSRTYGDSKMKLSDAFKSFLLLLRLWRLRIFSRSRLLLKKNER